MKNLYILSRIILDFIYYSLTYKYLTDIFYTYDYMHKNNINGKIIDLAFKLYQY